MLFFIGKNCGGGSPFNPRTGRFIEEDPIGFAGGVNFYSYCFNNPVNLIDPYGLWYIDINISLGYWGGGTGGAIISPEGIYLYKGGGVISPIVSGAIMWSPQDPAIGWNIGAQGVAVVAGQYGYSFSTKERFWEAGIGASYPTIVGGSVTGYYVRKLWTWPWRRGWRPWKWPWKYEWWPWKKDKGKKK